MPGLLGVSHKTAPVEIRESISFTEQEIIEFYSILKDITSLNGLYILSTCNRTEIYFSVDKDDVDNTFAQVLIKLKEFKGVSSDLDNYLYKKIGKETINHFFNVVSGLDSLVLGEYQIVKQVKDAFNVSLDNNMTNSIITRMVNKGLETGKRVRTETLICEGALSVSYAAVLKCQSHFDNLIDKSILLIGTGDTGELVLKNLKKKGCEDITLTNRTYTRAERLAEQYSCKQIKFEDCKRELANYDIVVTSTAMQSYFITIEILETELKDNNREQLFIDLSVPRNIEENISEITNITLYNVDDLKGVVCCNSEKRNDKIDAAQMLSDNSTDEFMQWLSSLNLIPTIKTIRTNLQSIGENELKYYKTKYSDIDNDILDKYSKQIIEKYSKVLIKNLKDITNNGQETENIKVLEKLFGIN